MNVFDLECTACGKALTLEGCAIDPRDGRRTMLCAKPECIRPSLEVALAAFECTALWLERAELRLLEQTPVKGFH